MAFKWNIHMVCLFFQIIFLYETFILSEAMTQEEVFYCYKSEITQDMRELKGQWWIMWASQQKHEKHVLQMGHMEPCKEALIQHFL